MAKCIATLDKSEVIRVPDEKAKELVASGQWVYVPKHLFKAKMAEV